MKLSQLSAKPQLIKLTLDDEDIIKEYGEPIDFWIHDRQKIDVFMKMATINQDNPGHVADLISDLLYDEDGTKIIKDDITVPIKVMMKIIPTVVEVLGKTIGQTSAN